MGNRIPRRAADQKVRDPEHAPLVEFNAAPEPLTGRALEHRLRAARGSMLWHPPLLWHPHPLTLRALEWFDPGVLWTLLHALDYLPAKHPEGDRPDDGRDVPTEMEAAKDRLADAKETGRADLIAMAEQMLAEAREARVVVARERRGGAVKESRRRRTRVLRALREGLGSSWGHVDVARLILESPAWRRPPCPTLATEYAGLEIELSNVIRRS